MLYTNRTKLVVKKLSKQLRIFFILKQNASSINTFLIFKIYLNGVFDVQALNKLSVV